MTFPRTFIFGAGVGAGLSVAETIARSQRSLALVSGAGGAADAEPSYPVVDPENVINHSPYSLVDCMCGLQDFCSDHSPLIVCQFIEPFQRIF